MMRRVKYRDSHDLRFPTVTTFSIMDFRIELPYASGMRVILGSVNSWGW